MFQVKKEAKINLNYGEYLEQLALKKIWIERDTKSNEIQKRNWIPNNKLKTLLMCSFNLNFTYTFNNFRDLGPLWELEPLLGARLVHLCLNAPLVHMWCTRSQHPQSPFYIEAISVFNLNYFFNCIFMYFYAMYFNYFFNYILM